MGIILTSVAVLGATGLLAAVVLYFVAKKFHVYENPKIAQVEEFLPGANCGACGYSGCHAFAVACAEASSLEKLSCPGAGAEGMEKIAAILGLKAGKIEPKVALVGCNGTCANRESVVSYDGVRSCAIEASYFGGDSACVYGCLGCGDCVGVCPHDAIRLDPDTHIPVVDFDICVGCGKCVSACPHGVIEIADYSKAKATVWVACRNHDKGAVAMKECKVACIGCGKCMRSCPAGAVKVDNFLAHIDTSLCIGCGKCVDDCPRGSIIYSGTLNPEAAEAPAAAKTSNP